MKHIRNILIPALFILFTFVMFSCDPDTDPDDTTNAREKFTGSWTCVEESQLTYTVVISPSSTNENEILLANFHTLGQNEQAVGLIAGYSVTIAEQSLCSGDYLVKGNGLMSANEKNISFQYVVTSGVSTDSVNATYTKQ